MGTVYVYTRFATTWRLQQQITAPDLAPNYYFGSGVAIDGNTLVIGSDGYVNSAYVYTRSGTTWSFQQKFKGRDTQGGDFFGSSVAIQGNTIVVGSQSQNQHGAAYIFTLWGRPGVSKRN